MTHDEMIAVIAAHRDGKEIEARVYGVSDSWSPCQANGSLFNFRGYEYRIKPSPPKPRELFIRLHADGALPVSGIVTSFSELPILASHWQNGDQIIKVREVLPTSVKESP